MNKSQNGLPYFMDNRFINLGEEVSWLLWQSGASESATVCFVFSLSICYWLFKCGVLHVVCVCVCVCVWGRDGGGGGYIKSKSPPIPSFTIPYISPLYSSLEGVSENKWVNSDTECTGKDCRFCVVCLLFNNHLRRAAPVEGYLSWTLSRKLCINLNSQFTISLYLCWLLCITLWMSASKIN